MRGVPATPFFMCVSEFLFLEQCLDSVTQELLTFRMGHLCPIFHMHRKNSHEPVTFTLVQRMRMVLPDLGTLLRAPPWWDHPTPDWRSELARPLSAIYTAGCLVREACATAPARAAAPVVCVGSALVGGAGKTPTCLALAQRLAARRPELKVHVPPHRVTITGPEYTSRNGPIRDRQHIWTSAEDVSRVLPARPTKRRGRVDSVRRASRVGSQGRPSRRILRLTP